MEYGDQGSLPEFCVWLGFREQKHSYLVYGKIVVLVTWLWANKIKKTVDILDIYMTTWSIPNFNQIALGTIYSHENTKVSRGCCIARVDILLGNKCDTMNISEHFADM